MFTFLLQTYRVKFLLQRMQLDRSTDNKPLTSLTYRLRHRFIWLADTLRSYLTETVVAFTTVDMERSMEKAEDIDEMAQIHVRYVAKLQERAMLSNELKPIHKAFVEALDLGVSFVTTATHGRHDGSIVKDQDFDLSRSKITGDSDSDSDESDPSEDEDEDSREGEGKPIILQSQIPKSSRTEKLQLVDTEFSRLISFLTAGLRSVGRVGAEPMWEQLAERLEWDGKKDRV
jgi:gamma-tubulin complex component 5